MIGFLAVLIAVVVVPVALYSAVRAVNHVFSPNSNVLPGTNPELEMRLLRMEEAIDAMAQQVERLRADSARRYVPEGGVEAPRLSRSIDSPPAP